MINIISLLLSAALLGGVPSVDGTSPEPHDWRDALLPAGGGQSVTVQEYLEPWRHFVELHAAAGYPRRVFPPAVERWRGLVEQYFRAADVELALAVIACESSGNPRAVNPKSHATGLWQHLPRYWRHRSKAAGVPGASLRDPEASTIVAAWLVYETSGSWAHWTCARSMDW